MKELKEKLDTLCIFRELLSDAVISALRVYLENPTSSAYAGFVAALYNLGGRSARLARQFIDGLLSK